MNVWGLPGPAGFLEAVERSLRDGSSVVVRFPRRVTVGFDDVVQARCDFAKWTVFRPDGARAPCGSLLERFAPRGSSLADLCVAPDFQGRLIWIDGVDRDAWPDCRQFLTDYTQCSRNVARLDRTRFLVLLTGVPLEEPPRRDVTLEVHDWRGAVSEMDLLFLAYERLEARGINETMRVLLATSVARVAAWDLGIAERLLEVESEDNLIDPTDVLQASQPMKGGRARRRWIGHSARHRKPAWFTPRWRRSIIRRANSIGASGAPRRRCCCRSSISNGTRSCRRTTGKIATHLQKDCDPIDPLDLEVGDLVRMVQRPGFSRPVSNQVRRLSRARNDLAHLRPLGLDEVRALIRF